jgi:CRISPR-associated protein Cmr6
MNLPLSKNTRDYFGDDKNRLLKISNIGLLFNKYFYCWQANWQSNEEHNKVFRKDIEGLISKQKGNNYIQHLTMRQKAAIGSLQSSGLQVLSFEATTDSRLIIGLGGTSVIETGMTLHPLYGFPYLPGSGIKGLARAYAETAVEPKPSGDELLEVFGSDHKDPQKAALDNRQGKVFFIDALPTQFPKLELDIMNPHYGEYYRGEKPPADYLNPVPVTFLAIAAGQKFSFALYSRDEKLLAKAKEWLVGGLSDLGAGGKTNVGYGYFNMLEQQVVEPAREQEQSAKSVVPKEDYLLAKLKSVKNAETFAAFIKQLDTKDHDVMNTISFKGMGSVINIGLVSTLESSEVSKEIKKIIAQKMLEICKEPDKKYAEKLKKYQQLQTIAGVDKP